MEWVQSLTYLHIRGRFRANVLKAQVFVNKTEWRVDFKSVSVVSTDRTGTWCERESEHTEFMETVFLDVSSTLWLTFRSCNIAIRWINSWCLKSCNCFKARVIFQHYHLTARIDFPHFKVITFFDLTPPWEQRHSYSSLHWWPCLTSQPLRGQHIQGLVTAKSVPYPPSAVATKGHPSSRGPSGN